MLLKGGSLWKKIWMLDSQDMRSVLGPCKLPVNAIQAAMGNVGTKGPELTMQRPCTYTTE